MKFQLEGYIHNVKGLKDKIITWKFLAPNTFEFLLATLEKKAN